MKEFYLMRHGQTRFNVQHRLQGVCDAPLTEVGDEQTMKDLKVLRDRILELLRASQSILLLKPYLMDKALVITLFNLVARVRPRLGIVWS